MKTWIKIGLSVERFLEKLRRRLPTRKTVTTWSAIVLMVILYQSTYLSPPKISPPPSVSTVSMLYGSAKMWSQFSPEFTIELRDYLLVTCDAFRVPRKIGLAVLWTESRGYLNDTSYNRSSSTKAILSIDYGLMQLNSLTFGEIEYRKASDSKLYHRLHPRTNPKDNIYLGIEHLAILYKSLKDWPRAIQAYNCGSRRVLRKTVPESTIKYLDSVLTFIAKY